MPWPRADFVLYALGAFIFAYGISICIRARRARAWAAARSCPTCRRPFASDHILDACTHYGATPPRSAASRTPSRWIAIGTLTSLAGLLLFSTGVAIVSWLDQLQHDFDGGSLRAAPDILLGPYVGAGCGLSLFALFLGVRAYRGDRPRGRRRCPRCWYLVDEGVGRKCSECGHEARRERDLFRPRRRWRLVAAALLLAAIGQLGWLEARVRRGGWLAAVPTEVLIVGMPWIPDWWLHGGHAAAEEDWSLTGRMYLEGGLWRWHRPWMRARAARWVGSTHDPIQLTRRLDALRISPRFGRAVYTFEEGPIAGHLLHVGLIASESGDAARARRLIGEAWEFGIDTYNPTVAPNPEFARDIAAHTDRLFAACDRDPGLEAGFVLALGDGRPEVVNRLLDQAHSGKGDATYALANLAARHPDAQRQMAAVIADPNDARRSAITVLVCRMSRGRHLPELVDAVRTLMKSDDPDEALTGVLAALTSMPSECETATRRGLALLEAHPNHATRALEALSQSRCLGALWDDLEHLAASKDRQIRGAARELLALELRRARIRQ